MATHPDLEAEQAYIDHAYECLEATRAAASRMTNLVEVGRGGTEQARFERDVIWDTMLQRLTQLDLGEAALCFGRIDFAPNAVGGNGSGPPPVQRVVERRRPWPTRVSSTSGASPWPTRPRSR